MSRPPVAAGHRAPSAPAERPVLTTINGLDATVPLSSIECEFKLGDVLLPSRGRQTASPASSRRLRHGRGWCCAITAKPHPPRAILGRAGRQYFPHWLSTDSSSSRTRLY